MLKNVLKNAFGRITGKTDDRQTFEARRFNERGAAKPARIGPAPDAMEAVFGLKHRTNILMPLFATKGIQFPYTPDITFGGQAEYQDFHFTHSNNAYHQYNKSMPLDIQVNGTFTCQTNDEGRYLIAVLRFLRSMTMMEFGVKAAAKQIAGTPPPVLRFNYLGEYMFSNIPVVITNFSYTLQRDVDYVGIRLPGGSGIGMEPEDHFRIHSGKGMRYTRPLIVGGEDVPLSYVPTKMELMVQMKVQQNPRHVRQEFDLDEYRRGGLIKKGFI